MLPHPKSKVALSVHGKGISQGKPSRLFRINDWPARAEQAEYNVDNLAKICGVSTRHLERLFKAIGWPPPKQCLRKLRMKRALELRREGLSVKEIADRLDFHDSAHFSKRFHDSFGVWPTEFEAASEHDLEASFAE